MCSSVSRGKEKRAGGREGGEGGERPHTVESSRLIYVTDDLYANRTTLKTKECNLKRQRLRKSIGAVSERSHFPPAKIKHFTRSCQILIRRKLAEEYHFPKQTGQVFLSPPPGVVSRSPSPL